MALFHLLLLALIQGITEFLPVSSSGHLILLPLLTDLQDQGAALDVAVHVGTLGAVMVYFRSDVARMIRGMFDLLSGKFDTEAARLTLLLSLATLPVIALGLVLKVSGLIDALRSITVIGWTMLIFGIILYVADQKGGTQKTARDWSVRDALVMGVWQALALIPGTSRSGATITAARSLGYERQDGTRLAMLMSIPTILASGVLLTGDVVAKADWSLARDAGIAAIFAFVAALGALALMMRLLRSISFTPYVIYRVCLGLVLLTIAYG